MRRDYFNSKNATCADMTRFKCPSCERKHPINLIKADADSGMFTCPNDGCGARLSVKRQCYAPVTRAIQWEARND